MAITSLEFDHISSNPVGNESLYLVALFAITGAAVLASSMMTDLHTRQGSPAP